MYTIALIIPYYGRLPNYFHLWLESAKRNTDIDFYIVSDDNLDYPLSGNVKQVKMPIDEFQCKLEAIVHFPVELRRAYKLTDYKPTYGLVFDSIVSHYDFWGYCDVDLIFGDIRSFVTDEILDYYDKVFKCGHFTLFRNTKQNNSLFLRDPPIGAMSFKEVCRIPYSCHFDENAICKIANAEGLKTYETCCFADVFSNYQNFELCGIWDGHNANYFYWDGKKLYRRFLVDNKIESMELMYVHLQKRKMRNTLQNNAMPFSIIPNSFVEGDISLTPEQLIPFGKRKLSSYYYRLRLKELWEKSKQGAIIRKLKKILR